MKLFMSHLDYRNATITFEALDTDDARRALETMFGPHASKCCRYSYPEVVVRVEGSMTSYKQPKCACGQAAPATQPRGSNQAAVCGHGGRGSRATRRAQATDDRRTDHHHIEGVTT